MRLSRLQEEQQKLDEMLKYSHLLDEQDLASLERSGAANISEIYNQVVGGSVSNIFAPKDEFEKKTPGANLVRVFRDPANIYLTAKHIFNVELPPFQIAILQELERRKYPMLIASRGGSKSWLLGLYALWILLFRQGSKIVITGSGFRQAKIVFGYMASIYKGAGVLQDIVGGGKHSGPKYNVDECRFHIGDSTAIAIPIGMGDKIRGLRATHLLNDEFSSLSEQIYEQVISGFASVSASPIENLKNKARIEVLKRLKVLSVEESKEEVFGNQSVLSGTADYSFKHFYKYFKQYKEIIHSQGKVEKLYEIFPEGIPVNFNWKNYSIIRIPFELLPPGFMDEEHVARSKATSHTTIFGMEYSCIFPSDSDGFFKRSVIESCTCYDSSHINWASCGRVLFESTLHGHSKRSYVIAIDPASEIDNFAIVILECWADHRRVVYCWTINKKKFRAHAKKGLTQETDFYKFCARKIRNLRKNFPCERIVMDAMGGGYSVAEALHDDAILESGEKPIWEIIEDDNKKDSDDFAGEHILELVQFADADWVFNANHFLKKDMMDKSLLFPRYDPIVVSIAVERDKVLRASGDEGVSETLEDVIFEIEELKTELTTIEHTTTINGRDKWSTPEIKFPNSKKGYLRKDRYTALLMANMAARTIQRAPTVIEPEQTGFSVRELALRQDSFEVGGGLYTAPLWYDDDIGGMTVKRK